MIWCNRLLLIPELVAQALVREDFSLTNAAIAITTLFSLVFLTSLIQFLSSDVAQAMTDQPGVLVRHGQLVEDNMNRESVDPAEIYGEMHKAGLHRLEQVKWAIIRWPHILYSGRHPADPDRQPAKW
ncbi:MAG: hypothetical protein OHK0046_27550 [Anaerolineae bacterium]